MALNARQVDFITKLKSFAATLESLYGEAHAIKESHAEEFDDAQDNSLLNENTALEAAYSFDSADIKTAVNQAIENFLNYWNGFAVTTREYGKDLRRIR
jgi:hypothetical protein